MKPIPLTDHPEGGRYCEVFRSSARILTSQAEDRSALTHIYFQLRKGEVSRFHKVRSDEVWNLYQGALKLHLWDGTTTPPKSITLSAEENCFCAIAPAHAWQAAEPITEEVLVGCSVGPGFEFEDFELITADSDEAQQLVSINQEWRRFI